MRIACVMMCKDESDLLPVWSRYHGELFGYDNLHVIDNGSTEPGALDALRELDARGADVDRSRSTPDDYRHKGHYQASVIKALDASDPADFYFPLDCDEFVGVERTPFDVSFRRSDIEAELAPQLRFPGTLAIGCAYDNNPFAPGAFFRSAEQRKTFFAQGACQVLDHGSHAGVGTSAETRRTALIYMHFHYRPFRSLRSHTENKLRPFTDDLSLDALERFASAGQPGGHLVTHLRHADEAEYEQTFQWRPHQSVPAFETALAELGTKLPFSEA